MGGNSESGLYSLILSSINPRDGGAIAQIDFAAFNSGISIPAMGDNRVLRNVRTL